MLLQIRVTRHMLLTGGAIRQHFEMEPTQAVSFLARLTTFLGDSEQPFELRGPLKFEIQELHPVDAYCALQVMEEATRRYLLNHCGSTHPEDEPVDESYDHPVKANGRR